ncbi:bis(5'-nucleosyl)-tetraphosphatase (symmetrical) YqeK [Lapidilactobacillus wuchangensis]|uniref:bis(5'-nucleosyl)-tetraphosphatase (symmetrical) YqeK n=1 Tax=Lapidilactobacillus wuchangensis TaxID=2486001 RepID=UPI000F787C35|nr:bis(5'-nucleosyl)-tetraphosphatase (symmetrical) YqeK [Lapidilactobacillus wuchangensis]
MTEYAESSEFRQLVPMSHQELVAKLRAQLSDYRFNHCLRVEQTAMTIAEANHADVVRAGIAGLLHDYAKEKSDQDFKNMIAQQHLPAELLDYGNGVWHGLVGQYFIKAELGITDPAILTSIAHHTAGSAQMSVLDKIVFVADYVEPGRDFPKVDVARQALATSLDAAVSVELRQVIEHLVSRQQKIYPVMLDAYNVYGIKQEEQH